MLKAVDAIKYSVVILGYIFYNHLVVKTNKVVYLMESSTIEFLDLLNEPAV